MLTLQQLSKHIGRLVRTELEFSNACECEAPYLVETSMRPDSPYIRCNVCNNYPDFNPNGKHKTEAVWELIEMSVTKKVITVEDTSKWEKDYLKRFKL